MYFTILRYSHFYHYYYSFQSKSDKFTLQTRLLKHFIDHILSSVSTVVNKISQGFKYCDNIETAFPYVKAMQNQYHPSQLLLDCSRDTCTKQNPGRI